MNRRTFGLAVRLLAVVAAIYAFFSFRSQLENQRQQPRPIPVQVVNPASCGFVTAMKANGTGNPDLLEANPSLGKAIETPGNAVVVRDPAECDRLSKLHGTMVAVGQDAFRIKFQKK